MKVRQTEKSEEVCRLESELATLNDVLASERVCHEQSKGQIATLRQSTHDTKEACAKEIARTREDLAARYQEKLQQCEQQLKDKEEVCERLRQQLTEERGTATALQGQLMNAQSAVDKEQSEQVPSFTARIFRSCFWSTPCAMVSSSENKREANPFQNGGSMLRW